MIENLRNIRSRNDFLKLPPLDFEEFRRAYFAQPEHYLTHQDHLSKIDDVLLPLNEFLGIRVLTKATAYPIPAGCDLKLLQGTCSSETFKLKRQETTFPWLKRIQFESQEKHVLAQGNFIHAAASTEELLQLTPQGTTVLAHWNYQAAPASNVIGHFEVDFFSLSHAGRKLIKLSRNLYAKEHSQEPTKLKFDFYRILDLMNEKDLFFIFATQSYITSKTQGLHFQEYFQARFPELV